MQKLFAVLVITSFMSITSTFAAEAPVDVAPTDITTTTAATPLPENAPVPTEQVLPVDTELNAAPTPAVTASMGSSLGEYKSVACSTNPVFSINSCNQCFVGGAVKVGDSITGLFDNWTNNSSSMLVAYEDEQKDPNMVSFGSTTWSSTPTDMTKFWKNSADITWVPAGASGSRMNYILQGGQKVKFVESELGARYTLEKTDKKDGETIGLLRFPVVSHVVDGTTGTEGPAVTHYECVSYALSAAAAPTPVTPEPKPATPAPTPAEVTQTQTGPAETLILIVAAFFIAFGMMFSLRKRS